MIKWLKSNENKKITGVIVFSCIILVAQIIAAHFLNEKLYKLSLEHTSHQVEELSEYVEQNFRSEIDHFVHILKVLELDMEREEHLDVLKALQLIQQTKDISGFTLMGVSDLDGKGIDSTGQKHHVFYENMRSTIEQDGVYISNIIKNEDEIMVFVAVPLKVLNQIQGVLWAKMPLKEIVSCIELNNQSYKYFQIIDDNGNYLVSSQNEYAMCQSPEETGVSVWEELEEYELEDGISIDQLHDRVQKGLSGNFYFECDGEGRYASYRPLGINNWYLFSIQVQDEMQSYVDHIQKLAVCFFGMLAFGLLLIFGFIYRLIYTMYKDICKQNQDNQSINAMLQAILQQTDNTPFIIDQNRKQVVVYNYPTKDMIKYCSFADITPEVLLQTGAMDSESIAIYRKLYQNVILAGKQYSPAILRCRMGNRREWIRVSILTDAQTESGQMIGVMQGYDEQKEKDLQIEMHLDDIKKIERKSQMDFLTQVYNRQAFMKRVQTVLRENANKEQIDAFMVLDLDHFKDINDCMGHGMGDEVLRNIADILRRFFRKEDIVGRLGGDEFVIFAQNIQDIKAFKKRLQRLNGLLCKTYEKDGKKIQISASVGIALTDAEHQTFSALYEKADAALYQVKKAGKNSYQIHSDDAQ